MNITVVGLGLIGGSICKSLKRSTFHHISGIDINKETCESALSCGAVDEIITEEKLSEADLTILCLYPEAIVEFVKRNAYRFKKGSIVSDCCGIKEYVVEGCTGILKQNDVIFLGCHPMAGREFSGFDYSTDNLFNGASFIVTPTEDTPKMAIDLISTLACCMGFGKVVLSTPVEHDINIAFTSQLAHVVSNAYVKSPSLLRADGFSAGSFQDLTRVAKLNEYMWTSLFMCNKKALLDELDNIIVKLTEYKDAMEEGNYDTLRALLKDGRELKEKSIETQKRKQD